MFPSLLARDIQQGIQQFLITGFEPADGFFHGVMRRFVENEPAWMKGPYLQIGLPFRHDSSGKNFFGAFHTKNPAYTHQREAWQRLASDHLAAHTLVATGTGSGKTECFSYPLLDHCARARQAGEGGIKALVIYPMNALAMDQARRFAQYIASTPAFHGLRVGLFVGGNTGTAGSGTMMRPDSVITDRDSMRRQPPDIYMSQRGRNLERLGKATLAPRTALVAQAAQQLTPRLHEAFGLHGLSAAPVFQWLWGWLTHLRRRGGVMHPELTTLARDGTIWPLVNTAGRKEWLPALGERTPRPVFVTLGNHPDFDRLSSPRGSTWWERWLEAVLGCEVLLPDKIGEPLYRAAFEVAEAVGLCRRTSSARGDTIALAPEALDVHTHTCARCASTGTGGALSLCRPGVTCTLCCTWITMTPPIAGPSIVGSPSTRSPAPCRSCWSKT